MQNQTQTLEEKLQDCVNSQCEYAEKNGSTKLSVCSERNWDSDKWNYRQDIMDAIRGRGYNVSQQTNWGVLDITTTKKITLT
jgi:hypothetical protein